MRRREFLASALGALAGAALPGCDEPAPPRAAGPRQIPWRNWSGYQHCLPAQRVAPESLDQLVELLRTAPGPVRPVGAGHSFTPLVPTDGTIVSLRNFEGLLAHDPTALTATLGAGTRLSRIGPVLDGIGQALPNMPDIDMQMLAGAIATGTHGTGQTLGALHSYVTALTLVTPRGTVLECSRSKNPEVFDAARVSLGSLGVVTEYTLQNVSPYNVKRREWFEPLDTLFDRFDELAATHYSFDLYLIPYADYGLVITIDPVGEPSTERPPQQDELFFTALENMRDAVARWPQARRWLTNFGIRNLFFGGEESVGPSHRMIPSVRNIRFHEMEYHVPREHLLPLVRKVRETMESAHPEIFFPVQVRIVKGDDAWLSPFGGHETSGSIAVHHHYLEDPLPYFATIEPLYQPLGGRPHWGKMHTLTAKDLAPRYPRWRDFQTIRQELDPEGRMLNPYLKQLFGA
jgi:FAD-linked oxidoreductase